MPTATAGPQLPPDSTGKVTGSFTFGTTPVIHIPVTTLVDTSGNAVTVGDVTSGLWVNVKAGTIAQGSPAGDANRWPVKITDNGGANSVAISNSSLLVAPRDVSGNSLEANWATTGASATNSSLRVSSTLHAYNGSNIDRLQSYSSRLAGTESGLAIRAILDRDNSDSTTIATTIDGTTNGATTASVPLNGRPTVMVQFGTATSGSIGSTMQVQLSVDGTTWQSVWARNVSSSGLAGINTLISTNGLYIVEAAAGAAFIRCSNVGTGGTVGYPITFSLSRGASPMVHQGGSNANPANAWAVNLNSYGGVTTSLGQKTMSASMPVTIASDQSAIAISAASLPLPTGAATEATATSGAHKTQITDSSGNAAVLNTTTPTSTDRALTTRSMTYAGPIAVQTPANLTASAQSSIATGLDMAGNITLTVHGTYGFTTTPPTYIFEASDDTGTTWYPITAIREDTGIQEQQGTLPANGLRTWNCSVAGYQQVRLRLTAWGTPTGAIVTRWSPGGFLFEPPATHIPNQRVQFQCVIANDTMTTTDAVRSNLLATRDYVAAAAANTVAVTAGRKLRLTGWTMSVKAPSTTAVGGMYTLRVNPTGAAVVTSPAVAQIACGLIGTQVAQQATSQSASFPDGGIELWGPMQFTVSGIGVASAGFYLNIQGYEY